MANELEKIIQTRDYPLLEAKAEEYIKEGDWELFLGELKVITPIGKVRDAVMFLLGLESVGGTDCDIFDEFQNLQGSNLYEIRSEAISETITILKDQIRNRNTFFIDAEKMLITPFAILYEDVVNARLEELRELESRASRNELLRTYYGFMILTMSGVASNEELQQHNRWYWRRRSYLSQPSLQNDTIEAINQMMRDLNSEINLNARYETLGTSSFLQDKCSKSTSQLLADIIRMTLYMTPWDRGRAAENLGRTGDSRPLEFLHHRLELEKDMKTKISIVNGIGQIGSPSSFQLLKEYVSLSGYRKNRLAIASCQAIGGIHTGESTSFLRDTLNNGSNDLKVRAIRGLAERDIADVPELVKPLMKSSSKVILREVIGILIDSGEDGKNSLLEYSLPILKKLINNRPSYGALCRLLSLQAIQESESIQGLLASTIRTLNEQRLRLYDRSKHSWWSVRYLRYYNDRLTQVIRLVVSNYSIPLPSELDSVIRDIASSSNPDLVIPLAISVRGSVKEKYND
ncbi:MAG: HEAT repeat domain-containing protein [Candidatus Thorarchaeota archaeon]|nr:HEAT repeat domain-containing protein [Candidatus Thorarchaeota archaeon]